MGVACQTHHTCAGTPGAKGGGGWVHGRREEERKGSCTGGRESDQREDWKRKEIYTLMKRLSLY